MLVSSATPNHFPDKSLATLIMMLKLQNITTALFNFTAMLWCILVLGGRAYDMFSFLLLFVFQPQRWLRMRNMCSVLTGGDWVV